MLKQAHHKQAHALEASQCVWRNTWSTIHIHPSLHRLNHPPPPPTHHHIASNNAPCPHIVTSVFSVQCSLRHWTEGLWKTATESSATANSEQQRHNLRESQQSTVNTSHHKHKQHLLCPQLFPPNPPKPSTLSQETHRHNALSLLPWHSPTR